MSQKSIPMISYPVEGLDMSEFVIDKSSVNTYDVQPEEFYEP